MDSLLKDMKYTLRTMARSPLFTAVALLTLALGIGASSTIFAFVNAILVRPLPVDRPEEIVHIYTSSNEEPYSTSSLADYRDLRDNTDAFTGVIGHASAIATLQHETRSEILVGELITGNAFGVLGIEPLLGRLLLPEDDTGPGAPRTVVLGEGLWQRRFGRSPDIIGSTVRFNGEHYQVVGIAPASFPGLLPGVAAEFWIPATWVSEVDAVGQIQAVAGDPGRTLLEQRGYRWMWIKGRLADGITATQARAQVDTVMARLAAEHPVTNKGRGAAVVSLDEVRYHPAVDQVLGPAAALLLGAVGLVLLVVCANLASMLLSRAQDRRREVAVRLALGASRARLMRQLLTESLLLAVGGGVLALLVARWTTHALLAWQPPIPFSIGLDVGLDGRVFLFTGAVAVGAAIVFGLLPARVATRVDLVTDLKKGERASRGAGRLSLRNALVVAQVAVSVVFLVSAGLLVRGLLNAGAIDVGFAPQRVAALGMDLGMHGYDRRRAREFIASLRDRAEALPGVSQAAFARRVPFDINVHYQSVHPDTIERGPDDPGFALDVTWIDRQYFVTLGVPLLSGRTFTPSDAPEAPRVAVINAAMARRFWNNPADAVGRRFQVGTEDSEPYEIVGVVADYKVRTANEAPQPLIHFAHDQAPSTNGYMLASIDPTQAGDARALIGELRRLALELDPALAFTETTTLAGFMDVTTYPLRMGATLLGAFSVLALALTSLGLYGVIACSVSRRRRELGIRFALGARPREVIALILREGMILVIIGAAVGLILAAAVGQLFTGMLYGVSVTDPIVLGGTLGVLFAIALAANAIPAIRAARVDPLQALKDE